MQLRGPDQTDDFESPSIRNLWPEIVRAWGLNAQPVHGARLTPTVAAAKPGMRCQQTWTGSMPVQARPQGPDQLRRR